MSVLKPRSADSMEIKTNHMVVITPKMNLLQIPIKDKFYVSPSDPAALTRATDFAQEKGLLNPQARKSISTANAPVLNGRRLSKSIESMTLL
jgi:glutamine amidotransferase